jgi:hypothetical protein
MSITERTVKIAIALYGLLFIGLIGVGFIGALFSDDGGDGPGLFLFAGLALLPAVLYFFRVRWCRYVVGVLSAIALLIWSVLPMALHAVDRGGRFWIVWPMVWLVFAFSSCISFVRVRETSHDAA